MPQKKGHLYQFGPFRLDTIQHLLLREGRPVSLTPKTYDALVLLVENSGRMLQKDGLISSLWPNSFVDESNLTQQISMIRKSLGEAYGENRYIVTVPERGYRFVASVIDRSQPESQPATPERCWDRWLISFLVGIAIAGLVYFFYSISSRGGRRSGLCEVSRFFRSEAFATIRKVSFSVFRWLMR
jgi:DNA-binding winged helix-turn-helix (wHTH) protein